MARSTPTNLKDSDARMRPGAKGRPGGNITDHGYEVNTNLTWQRMSGNASNANARATGRLVDPNTKDKPYVSGNER